jgi:hypothetical protein
MSYIRSSRYQLRTLCFALMISCALMLAQWAGYSHRFMHLTTVKGTTITLSSVIAGHYEQNSQKNNDGLLHSCLLVDAATVSDAVHFSLKEFIPLSLSDTQTYLYSNSHWHALLQLAFSSRAPPIFS